MTTNAIKVQGTLREDGTLVLDEKPNLSPGRVKVTVESVPDLTQTDVWQILDRIWAGQRARGHVPRTMEEIDAYLATMRDDDERCQSIEQIQEECQRHRESQKKCRNDPLSGYENLNRKDPLPQPENEKSLAFPLAA